MRGICRRGCSLTHSLGFHCIFLAACLASIRLLNRTPGAPGPGGAAGDPPEGMGEMLAGSESELESDVRYRQIAFAEQRLGAGDPPVEQPAPGWLAGMTLEQGVEMTRRDA